MDDQCLDNSQPLKWTISFAISKRLVRTFFVGLSTVYSQFQSMTGRRYRNSNSFSLFECIYYAIAKQYRSA